MMLHPGQVDDGTGCPQCLSVRWDADEQYCSWCGYEPEFGYEDMAQMEADTIVEELTEGDA